MGDRTCSVEGCEGPRWARGWCNNHYQLWRRNGAPIRVKGRVKSCAIEDCPNPAKTRGWCATHYGRWLRTGDPGDAAIKTYRSPVVNGQKTCGTCSQSKPLDGFNKHPHGTGGVGANCRACLAAASKAWFAANPDYRAQWRTANAGVVLDHAHRCRALRQGSESERIDPAVVYKRDEFTCRLCGDPLDMAAARHEPLGPSLDHIVPLSRGGAHTYANIQAAHLYCNVSKGNRSAPLSRPA